MIKGKFDRTTEDVYFYAFRYALGRKTGAVSEMVMVLLNVWQRLRVTTQDQIKHEIEIALSRADAGMDCDVEQWKKILEK